MSIMLRAVGLKRAVFQQALYKYTQYLAMNKDRNNSFQGF